MWQFAAASIRSIRVANLLHFLSIELDIQSYYQNFTFALCSSAFKVKESSRVRHYHLHYPQTASAHVRSPLDPAAGNVGSMDSRRRDRTGTPHRLAT
jgi:hypothetical protein